MNDFKDALRKFKETQERMEAHGIEVKKPRIQINVPNARQVLADGLTYFLSLENRKLEWQPEYEQIAEWLADNDGRGLFLFGNCGRGKTLITQQVIPTILLHYVNKVVKCYNIQDLNANNKGELGLDAVLKNRIITLDDIGTESVLNNYGNKRYAFPEIIDAVEKQSKLILITTNLNAKELTAFYDERTMERIIATTKRIEFKGKSLRK